MDKQKIAKELLTVAKELIAAKGPFTDMDKRTLRKWIDFYSEMAPENFFQDGEYGGTYASRVRDLMRLWPRLPQRAQESQYKDLQSWAKMTNTKIARELVADLKLSPKDKKVIDAFTSHKKGESKKLTSDGKKLDGNWMGGREIAVWNKDGKIELGNLTSRAEQTVQRALRKMTPKNYLAD